jgi:hypothetical protein
MAPLIAKAGLPGVRTEAVVGPTGPEPTIVAVTPERMPLATIRKAVITATISRSRIGAVTPKLMSLAAIRKMPITAAISEAALAITIALVTTAARVLIRPTVELPRLASVRPCVHLNRCVFSVSWNRRLFLSNRTRIALGRTYLAARGVALRPAPLAPVLLHVLSRIHVSFALCCCGRHCDGARK